MNRVSACLVLATTIVLAQAACAEPIEIGSRLEIQDEAGKPIPGFALEDCPVIFGDHLDRVIPWKDGKDLAALSGKTVRLRVELKDADLYSFQFRK